MPRAVILAPLAALLVACASPPPVCPPPEVVRIEVERVIPVPEWLTADCSVACPPPVTNGDLLICYHRQKQALELCNSRLAEIAGLQ